MLGTTDDTHTVILFYINKICMNYVYCTRPTTTECRTTNIIRTDNKLPTQ